MQKNSYVILALILMVFIGLQMAEPAAAAKSKLIDKGKAPSGDGTVVWKAYQYSKTYIIVKEKFYEKRKLVETNTIYIKKTGKYKIKTVEITRGYAYFPDGSGKMYYYYNVKSYIKSSLSARSFYFQEIRPKT